MLALIPERDLAVYGQQEENVHALQFPGEHMPDQAPKYSRGRQRIDRLRQKKEQIEQALKDAEARLREQARRDDTRRKIIAGALALEHRDNNRDGTFAKKLDALLDEYVLTDRERALFGLAPLPKAPASNDDQKPPSSDTLKDHFPS